jgi:PEP-CTERM motif
MKRNRILAVLALSALPAAGWANTTLLDENFNELTPQLAVFSAGAFTAIDGTNVDIVGGGLYGNLCAGPEGGNCIDLDGSGGNPEGVLRSNGYFFLQPGVDYYLSFDLIGSQRGNTTSASVNFGPYSETFTLGSGDDTSGVVSNQLVTVSVPTIAFLTFRSDTPGNVGTVLDNVVVTSRKATVPEPGSLGLAALGMAAVGFLRRRRGS